MRYMGGKAKVGRKIAAVLLAEPGDWSSYVEPFVGACGVMEHVAPAMMARSVPCVGSDRNAEMIALWTALRDGWIPPENVDEAEYRRVRGDANESPALRGFVSVGCSFGGKVWGGYARGRQNYARGSSRTSVRAAKSLRNVEFFVAEYADWSHLSGALLYLDPPYGGTTGWGAWDPDVFWAWARKMAKDNMVFVSEYAAPDGWEQVWSAEFGSGLRCGTNGFGGKHVERLFRFRR